MLNHIRTVPAEQDAHPSVKAQRNWQAAEAAEKQQAAAEAEQPAPLA